MTPLFTDTTCSREGGTSTWEATYNVLEEEQPRILETKVTIDRCDSSYASMSKTTCSFLHHIVSCLKIIPYIDMVKWLLMKSTSQTENSRQEAKRLWDLLCHKTCGLCTTYQSHKSSTTSSSSRIFRKRTRTQQTAPEPGQIMREKLRKKKTICSLLCLFVPLIVLQQPCHVDYLANPIVLNSPQNDCH